MLIIIRALPLALGSPIFALQTFHLGYSGVRSVTVPLYLTISVFCSVKEERSLMIKGRSSLLLFDQGFLFCFLDSAGVIMFGSVL